MRALPPCIQSKSRMRERARTDLCGGRRAIRVPTATKCRKSVKDAGIRTRIIASESAQHKSPRRVVRSPPSPNAWTARRVPIRRALSSFHEPRFLVGLVSLPFKRGLVSVERSVIERLEEVEKENGRLKSMGAGRLQRRPKSFVVLYAREDSNL